VVVDLAERPLFSLRAHFHSIFQGAAVFSPPNRKRAASCPFVIRASTVFVGTPSAIREVENPLPWNVLSRSSNCRALENGIKVHVLITAKGSQDRYIGRRRSVEQKAYSRGTEIFSMKYIFVTGGSSAR